MDSMRVIYIVDDDLSYRDILELVFKGINPLWKMCFFDDSEKFLDDMKKEENHQVHPHLIIIDINMPRIDGIEVIRRLRLMPRYKYTPLLLSSTSQNPRENTGCYDVGGNGFFSKGFSMDILRRDIMNICKYWFETIQLTP